MGFGSCCRPGGGISNSRLAETPGVEIRTKRDCGSADAPQEPQNRWAIAAHRRRDLFRDWNGRTMILIVIESAAAEASFKRNFDARFANGEVWQAGAKPWASYSHE
jgi:hypothetical protein